MKLISGIILTLLLASMLISACSIQPVEGEPETRCVCNNGQGTACEDQTSQQTSASLIKNSDGSIGELRYSDKLEVDYESGKICIDEYLLYKAWRVFDQCRLPREYAWSPEEVQLYSRSGTMVIQEIRENWKNLNPQTQNELEFVFKRPTDVSGAADDRKMHLLPELYNTTNFVIHWTNGTDGGASGDAVPSGDANANRIPDYIEDFAAIFENVRSFEVGNRGFHAPPDDAAEPNDANRRNPDQRYDIFLYNMSSYGWTVPEQSSTPSYSHIEVDNDYLGFNTAPLQAMQVTAAHEYFHAIQSYYDLTEEKWWKEATSTYMEDEVYPDVNDNYQYISRWFQMCDSWGLERFGNQYEYGDFIFAKRLSEDFGDDVIKEIWEEMRVTDGTVAIDNALVRRGSSFVNEFNRFTRANFFLEDMYVDGTDYRRVLTESPSCTFNGVWREYEYDASFEFDNFVIDAKNVNYDAWMDRWATDYVTIKLDPTINNYRIFFDGLDLTTNYLVTMAWKQNGVIFWGSFSLDAQKDSYVNWPYDPTTENLTLIISNVGNTATSDPSWRVVITKLLPQMNLFYDDGASEESYSWKVPGYRFAVRFTPTTSGRLTECSFYIESSPAPVQVRIMDSSRNDLITPFLKTPTGTGWIHVDLSAFQVTVNQGVDFYIAIESTVADAPFIGSDKNDPDGRSWDYVQQRWIQFPTEDYMIRALVATESPDLARADLIIFDMLWTPSIPMEGNIVTFEVNIKNRGPVNAGSFKVAYQIDGIKIGEWSISSLTAGQHIDKSFTWTAVQGNHTVNAFADSSYNVEEKVEINNVKEKAFQVVPEPKPDLIISDIFWVPETPVNGTTVTFTVTIKNNGTANAGSFKTAYYINQTKMGEWSITSLSVGQEVKKTFTWTYVEGSHTVKAIADSNGEIQEDDETNNVREEVIGLLHDLAVTNVTAHKSVVGQAYAMNINVTIADQGDAAEIFTITIYANQTVITMVHNINLTNQNSITITSVWNTTGFPYGNYTMSAKADTVPGETDTTDNFLSGGLITVTIPGDINGDLNVKLLDLYFLAQAYGSKPGDPKWNPNADVDGNGAVGLSDLVALAQHYGQHYP